MKWSKEFKIVSFYTPDYEEYVSGLIESIEEHLPSVSHEIDPISQTSWANATCYKGSFMREKLEESDCAVLWIDVDAVVKEPFGLPDVDFAIFARFSDRLSSTFSPFRTGTVFFGYSKKALNLVKRWERECASQSDGIDQWALFRAWKACTTQGAQMPSTYFLPRDYCRKVDELGPVKIQHLMASRRKKSKSTRG